MYSLRIMLFVLFYNQMVKIYKTQLDIKPQTTDKTFTWIFGLAGSLIKRTQI